MMVNTVEVLELWRSMAKTLGRICHQTFITTPEMQTMAGMNREGEVSCVILSLLICQPASSCCVFNVVFPWFRRHRQEEHLKIP